MSIRFKKPKERIKVANRDQGLRMKQKKVFVKGKNRRKTSVAESLAFLQRNEEEGGIFSTFPDDDGSESEQNIKKMARKTQRISAGGRNKVGGRHKVGGRFGGLANSTTRKQKPTKRLRNRHSVPTVNDDDTAPQTSHPPRHDRIHPPPTPVIPRKAPMVDDTDSDDLSSFSGDSLPSDFDFDMLSSDDDMSSLSSFSSGLSSMSSTGKGKKRIGPRRVSLDDSMSIINGQDGSKKNKKNMFAGFSKKESEEAEKNDLLARFHILRQRGVHLTKNYSSKSSLNEMRMEMGRIEHENNVAKSIQINRRFFMASTSALTKVTDNYAPNMVRGKWHGFDKYVLNSINDYDEPFERLSEHYGGVIGAITGGNPLWEIFVLFAYQFVSYGFMSDGGEQARANEDMTADEIKKRFPNLLKEAVEKEMNKKREDEFSSLRQEQFNQRAEFKHFDAQQQRAQMQAPPPVTQIRPPSTSFHQLYPQQQQYQQQHMQVPELQQISQVQQVPISRGNLNAENPNIAHFPTMEQHEPQPRQQQDQIDRQFSSMNTDPVLSHVHDMDINLNTNPPIENNMSIREPVVVAEPDPYLFNEMHAALPQIDIDENTTILGDDYDISDSDDEILGNPIGTRGGRPSSMNQPPPNKRDEFDNIQPPTFASAVKPSAAQVKATRDNGYVININ